jgi:C-terminal processing protease CtpA/Prc
VHLDDSAQDRLYPHQLLQSNDRLIVLINEYTASTNEIASGVVQEWNREIIVGPALSAKDWYSIPSTCRTTL